jgi:hypothetical protein
MSTTERQPIPYKVKDKVTGDVIYVEANNRSQARSFAALNRFEVTPLTVREALKLAPKDILDATASASEEQGELPIPKVA